MVIQRLRDCFRPEQPGMRLGLQFVADYDQHQGHRPVNMIMTSAISGTSRPAGPGLIDCASHWQCIRYILFP
jgi:hypothetical protein